jgi:glyoxylase-like metal-dependent hydrolase (beta-lactamase superfamily II)
LISQGTRHVAFDLAVRPGWENYAPRTVALIKQTTKIAVEMNVAEIVDAHAEQTHVTRDDVEAALLSHMHFDHI